MQLIDNKILIELSGKTKNNERLRMNLNFHATLDAPAQRLLNALEIGTQIPIHRHKHTAETYILLSGKIKVLFYNDDKTLIDSEILNQNEGKFDVHIPATQWHSLEVLENGSVIFEVKDGPYKPISEEDILTLSQMKRLV